jgi:ankyrin repeat protein
MAILAHYGDFDTASAMLADNPALADDEVSLNTAASAGREDFVRLLLRYQPDLATRVTVSRPREMAKLLFEHGMDPNRPNWLRIMPLHYFAETGDVESAALFIDHGADLDPRDEEWCATPLAWAANFGHTRFVEYLLRRGARTRLADDPAWATPLALAAHRGHTQIVELLTEFERSGALPSRDVAYYEGLVRDLLEACESGEESAMGRLAAVFRIARGSFNWTQRTPMERMAKLRRFVVEQLGGQSGPESERDVPIASDARLLVARAHGFETWTRLIEETERTPPGSPGSRNLRT